MQEVYVAVDLETEVNPRILEEFRLDEEVFTQPKLPVDPSGTEYKWRDDWGREANLKHQRIFDEKKAADLVTFEADVQAAFDAHLVKIHKEGALNAALGDIACISCWAPPQERFPDGIATSFLGRDYTARQMLEAYWDLVAEGGSTNKAMTLIGHNFRRFDLSWLHIHTALERVFGEERRAVLQAIYDPWKPAYQVAKVVDTYDRLPYKLAQLAPALLGEMKAPISDKVWQLIQAGDWDTVGDGCLQHARLEFQLAHRLGMIPDSLLR